MASSINASTAGVGGVITTADNTGILNIQSGGSTKIAVTSAGVAVTGTLSSSGIGSFGNGVTSIGSGGTGATDAVLRLNGGSTANSGSLIQFLKNSVSYNQIGTESITVGGTGNGLAYLSGTGLGHKFYVNNSATESMILDASGNLLVGTTSNANTARFKVQANGTNVGSEFYQPATTSYTSIIFTNPNGTVGSITTTSAATSYATSSDYRLKENIEPMVNALATVQALKPVTYNWKLDGSDGQGFIAHELAEVVPDCVIGEKDAIDEEGNPVYQGIDTSFLVATLTAAIQELKAIVSSQADTLATQAEQIKALQGAK